jgi:hypothetical protein
MKSRRLEQAMKMALISAAVAMTQALSPAHAATTLTLDLGVDHSDNVGRVEVDPQSETIGTAGLGLAIDTKRPRLSAEVGANLEYQKYFDNTFDPEVVGGVDATLGYALIKERLIWVLEDNYGQISNNRLAVETPDNRQDFNYLSTGPDLTLPLGQRNSIFVSGRWSDSYYEEAGQDSQGLNGSLALIHALSEMSNVSLNGSWSQIEYDNELFEDNEVREAFLRFDAAGVKTTLVLDVGYTETTRGDREPSDGWLGRLSLTRQLSARTSIELSAGSEFSDAGQTFRLDQQELGTQPGNVDVIAVADVFRSNYLYLGLTADLDRTTVTANLHGNQERYETQDAFDRDIVGASISVERALSPRFTLGVEGDYSKEEFVVGPSISFDEWFAGLSMNWELTSAWALRATAHYYEGSGEGIARNYDETRAFVGVRYTLGR